MTTTTTTNTTARLAVVTAAEQIASEAAEGYFPNDPGLEVLTRLGLAKTYSGRAARQAREAARLLRDEPGGLIEIVRNVLVEIGAQAEQAHQYVAEVLGTLDPEGGLPDRLSAAGVTECCRNEQEG